MRRALISLLYFFITITLSASEIKVSGYVRDNHGKPVSGVKVTDGFDIVRTDAAGHYELNARENANFVYISVPSGFETSLRNGAPHFYKQIDRSNKTQKSDFEIIRTGKDETHHQFVVFADVQVYNESEIDYVYKAAADVQTDIVSNGVPTFGMSCGDIVGTWSSGLSEKIQTATSSAGFPFYALMGNHDYQSGVGTNEESKVAYTSKYGPTYYSFDKGQMHYVVLDDVFYFYRHYIGYLEDSQLEWLKKDLSDVPEGSTVVLFLHIPTYSKQAREGQWNKEEYNKIVTNRNALYKIMEPYKLHICSAHEHYAENYVIKDNIFEHVHAPLSGLFWQSLYSCDGVPWGYYVYDVKGNEITEWYYKPVGKSRDCQFSAYRVGEDPMKRTSVVANVWNYDPAWKVEWRENGVDQGPMTQYSGWDRNIVNDVDNRREKEFTWKYIGAGQTDHLFYATPFSADSDIEIVVTDRFGKVYTWNSSRDSIYSTTSFTLNSDGVSEEGREYSIAQSSAYSKYGSFHGADKLETNLYNLAISEMVKNIEPDGTFRTGQLWSGVWTRDISYSAILSLAHLEPEVVKTSLMRKVDKKGRIIEDTGTGGSWPCSTDREVWAIAAYEVYLETGDVSWLRQVYPIIRRSLEADLMTVYNNSVTGLFRGESSFIDWREQSYPSWMQPSDIAASECLGTNAVFYRALEVASLMASKLGPTRAHDVKRYATIAANLKRAINDNFWMEDKGYYAQFLYGRDYRYVSPRSETLGESLCILWNIASVEQAQRIMGNLRVCDFGPTIFSPQISAQKSYHNNAIWPFVTSFYGMAAAKTGNRAAVMHALASNMRAATVFESNMENMVASNGSKNTALNSPRQLWSVAGFEGLFRNVLLGINYTEDGISFSPCVPTSMKGYRALENFKYRNMTLDVEVIGEGNIVSSCLIDGVEQQVAFLPASLEGHHNIQLIVKSDYYAPEDSINLGPLEWDLNTPEVELSSDGEFLKWAAVNGATNYRIYKNGVFDGQVEDVLYKVSGKGEYVVAAYNESGSYSFMSEPIRVGMSPIEYTIQKRLNNRLGVQVRLEIEVESDGEYLLEFDYSNGNGDITTHNRCASRTLFVDKKMYDVVVLPQRGTDWTLRGLTQPLRIGLTAGKHIVELKYLEDNVNMNIETDSAVINSLRIIRAE